MAEIRRSIEPVGEKDEALPLEYEMRRSLEGTRLTLLGVLVAIGLAVGFGIECHWWVKVAAGIGATVASALLLAWQPTRKRLLQLMDRVMRE